MAPSWVLLDRDLFFSHDEALFAGESEGGGESVRCASEERKLQPSEEEYVDAIAAYLRSLKPNARLADPPELSSLDMLRPAMSTPPLCYDVTSACISSADKHLVALYAGHYRPGHFNNRGCYLIYDASKNSISTIPQLPIHGYRQNLGPHTAVVACDGDGAGYTLAELVGVESSAGDEAELYLWYSCAKKWIVKAGRLPWSLDENFSADMCFHYRPTTSLCWVDLLKGIVVCDLSEVHSHCSVQKLSFIPLPAGTTYDRFGKRRELYPGVFRSMACIDGFIKFVTIDGYVEQQAEDLKLTLWTLSSDLSGWNISKQYNVGNIWANETYLSTGMAKIAPSFPVLSMHEANVVYIVFSQIRYDADDEVEFNGQYVLRVDMDSNELQICQASTTDMIIRHQLFASEFSAYQQ